MVGMPAMATSESCLQQISQTATYSNRAPYDEVSLLAEISHEGKAYYWYDLKLSNRPGALEIIAAEDSSGQCLPVSVDYGGNYVTNEQYEQVLGKDVSDKFSEYFRQKQ